MTSTKKKTKNKKLISFGLLDVKPEPIFDAITQLTAEVCNTPYAFISFISNDTQWLVSNVGLDNISSFPANQGFCIETIKGKGIREISSTLFDKQNAKKHLVREAPHVHFYAGVPITLSDDSVVGTIAVLDDTPRILHDSQRTLLIGMAEVIAVALQDRQLAQAQIHSLMDSIDPEALSLHQLQLTSSMSMVSDAVIYIDSAGLISYLNPTAEILTGWTNAEAQGQIATHVLQLSPALSEHNEITRSQSVHNLQSRAGDMHQVKTISAPITGKSKSSTDSIVVLQDITLLQQLQQQLDYQASHDLLTGCLNRTEFEHQLELARLDSLQNNRSHALMYFDLDQFKIINALSSRALGDEILQQISQVIRNCIRSCDKLARLGGDEFGLILEDCAGAETALSVAQHILQRIEKYRHRLTEFQFSTSASLGLVMVDDHWADAASLIQAAESACFAAKEAGRNRVHLHYESDYVIRLRKDEMRWASKLVQAIEENQFVLFCQRIMPANPKDGAYGEVLIRMQDGQGGLIGPSVFLPAAERFHLATRIDRWVVAELFKWMSNNAQQLQHMASISVNLSGQSISDRKFHLYVLGLLETLGVDCEKLCFEITETAAISNLVEANCFIDAMRQRKVRFSLDDFGSGISSFGYLKNLAVDYLKIDGQFIQGLIENKIDQATVRCIIEVAKVTGKKTIAEWVEDESVEKLLQDIGIDFTQGFLRHKPAPLSHMLDEHCSYQH